MSLEDAMPLLESDAIVCTPLRRALNDIDLARVDDDDHRTAWFEMQSTRDQESCPVARKPDNGAEPAMGHSEPAFDYFAFFPYGYLY
jgi:hypothetical protein